MQHDQAPHDATTTSAPVAFHSPQLSNGQSWSYTFRTAGTYAYYCSVHPDMRATIVVVAAPAAQPKPGPAPVAPAPVKQHPVTSRATAPPSSDSRANIAPAPSATTTNPAAGGQVATAEPPAVDQQQTVAAAATGPSLDPMLLVAGLVTGIAVLCLLLLGSRRAS
jgi:choline dehydrogenase-like flavoprotein